MAHLTDGGDIVGPISTVGSPPIPSIVVCSSLDDLDLMALHNVLAVCPERVGRDCHVEVICKIKGIPVGSREDIQPEGDLWKLKLPRYERWMIRTEEGHPKPVFQVSIFDADDARRIAGGSARSAFVRLEHVLTALAAGLDRTRPLGEQVEALARPFLEEVVDALPRDVDLIVRGLDVRSGDVLAERMRIGDEANPDLGEHGLRRLLADPGLAKAERQLIRTLGSRVRYALPFVTRSEDLRLYLDSHPIESFERPPVLFLESPAALAQIADFAGFDLAIGLKDVAQFFFAADRSNASVAKAIEYGDPAFVRIVCDAVRSAIGRGSSVSLYQDRMASSAYESALKGIEWTRSIPASVHREVAQP